MLQIDFGFRWSVPKGGHLWLDGQYSDPRLPHIAVPSLLVENHNPEHKKWTYSPLKEVSGLFRIFSDVETTKEDMLRFADQYGSLGLGTTFRTGNDSDTTAFLLGRPGESINQWTAEVTHMKEAVTVLDLVRAEDHDGLARWLKWRECNPQSLTPSHPPSWVYEGPRGTQFLRGSPALFNPLNIFAPALALVMMWTNEKLRGHTFLALTNDQGEGDPVLEISIETLLTAMWLQLAQGVAEPADAYRRCKTCNRWFAVPPDKRKADQIFCQDSCKSKDYRQRKDKARQLANEGMAVQLIAVAVGTDVTIVDKWLVKGKRTARKQPSSAGNQR